MSLLYAFVACVFVYVHMLSNPEDLLKHKQVSGASSRGSQS